MIVKIAYRVLHVVAPAFDLSTRYKITVCIVVLPFHASYSYISIDILSRLYHLYYVFVCGTSGSFRSALNQAVLGTYIWYGIERCKVAHPSDN